MSTTPRKIRLALFWLEVKLFLRNAPAPFVILVMIPAYMFLAFLFILLLLFLYISLSSVPAEYAFLYPTEQIADIAFVHVPDEARYSQVDSGNYVICVELEEAQFPQFLTDFNSVSCKRWIYDPWPYLRGGTVQITCRNGSYELLSAFGAYFMDAASGESDYSWYFFGDEEFLALLEKYGYTEP